jgi:hypothetical protein
VLTLNKLEGTICELNYECKATMSYLFFDFPLTYSFIANLNCRSTEYLLHSFPRLNIP